MARLFKPNKFEQDEVGLTIRLSRDMIEEREVLDYLAAMNPKRVQATMINMLVAGYYHLVKKSHASNREPQIRKKMTEIHQELRSDEKNAAMSVAVVKPKEKKPKPEIAIETVEAKIEVIKPKLIKGSSELDVDVAQSETSDETIPFFLQDGFNNDEPEQPSDNEVKKGLSAGKMFGGISG